MSAWPAIAMWLLIPVVILAAGLLGSLLGSLLGRWLP